MLRVCSVRPLFMTVNKVPSYVRVFTIIVVLTEVVSTSGRRFACMLCDQRFRLALYNPFGPRFSGNLQDTSGAVVHQVPKGIEFRVCSVQSGIALELHDELDVDFEV